MRTTIGFTLALSLVTLAPSALADDRAETPKDTTRVPDDAPEATGLSIGGRVGYGAPMGKASGVEGADLSKLYDGMFPLWLDVGYRTSRNFYLGAFFQYGFGMVSSDNKACVSGGVNCSINNVRLGLNVHYHFLPLEQTDPWIGIGAGYEWGNFDAKSGTSSGSVSFSGWEIVNVQLGVDFKASSLMRVGPFAALGVAQYSNGSMDLNGSSTSSSIDKQALHEWLIVGLRTQLDL